MVGVLNRILHVEQRAHLSADQFTMFQSYTSGRVYIEPQNPFSSLHAKLDIDQLDSLRIQYRLNLFPERRDQFSIQCNSAQAVLSSGASRHRSASSSS